MASRRKKFVKRTGVPEDDSLVYADFLGQLMAGTITASKLYDDVRKGNGRPDFDYEDPNG